MMGFGWVRYIGWVGLVKIPMGHFCPFPRLQNPRGREGLANQPPHMPQVALRSTASTRPRRCRRRRARLQPRCRIWRRALVDVGGLARSTPHGRWEGMGRNSPREQSDNPHGLGCDVVDDGAEPSLQCCRSGCRTSPPLLFFRHAARRCVGHRGNLPSMGNLPFRRAEFRIPRPIPLWAGSSFGSVSPRSAHEMENTAPAARCVASCAPVLSVFLLGLPLRLLTSGSALHTPKELFLRQTR